MVALPFDVAKIRQCLRMVGIEGDFALEFLPGCVILLRLPIQVAETEMDIGLAGRYFRGGFEFGNRLRGPSQTIERFASENVGGRGVRILFLNPLELLLRARKFT